MLLERDLHMARQPRYFVEGQPQHIIQRGNNRELIFACERDYRFYLECLKEAADQHALDIHAYVLMTNHVHVLATPHVESSISKTFQSLGRRYVQYFNYSYKRTGTLWEGRYKATLIDSDRYLFTCMRYIELNPVRAGMTAHPAEYPWSSYHVNALGRSDSLVRSHMLYNRLGSEAHVRQSHYRKLFCSAVSREDLKAIRDSTNTGWVLGNDRFRNKMEQLSGRRTAPRSRGRPRKGAKLSN